MVEIKQIIGKALIVTAINDPFKLEVYYIDTHKWEIVVTHSLSEIVKERVIPALHEPIFGIDQADWSEITANAEALCEDILGEIDGDATSGS